MPAAMTDNQPEHISGYYPDVWAAAQWMRGILDADHADWMKVGAITGAPSALRWIEAHQAIIRHYIELDAEHNLYAGAERIQAMAGVIEALAYAHSDRPGYNPAWQF